MGRGIIEPTEELEDEDYRIDHYYSLEGEGEIEEGHIFCTPAEGALIQEFLRSKLPDVTINVEPGGEYDYSTEGMTAQVIAEDILADSGFNNEDWLNDAASDV